MNKEYKKGTVFKTTSGDKYRVLRLISAGAEGRVYDCVRIADRRSVAVKVYHTHIANAKRRKKLEKLIAAVHPGGDKFAWPETLVERDQTFGYVMSRIPDGWCDLVDLYDNRVSPEFSVIVKAAINICLAFRMLHRCGFCYGDINMKNFRFSPEDGQIMICDCDNIVCNGEHSEVNGTGNFRAPEIIRGEAGVSTDTDRHALAVLLFYFFCVHHPLDGVREWKTDIMDEEAEKELYGIHPVFIFDPADRSNRPVKAQENAYIYWNLLPAHMRALFVRAFSEGLHHPERRIVEDEWLTHLYALLGGIMKCPVCGAESFYKGEKEKYPYEYSQICWNPECRNKISVKQNLHFSNGDYPLYPGVKLYPAQTEGRCGWDALDRATGAVGYVKEKGTDVFLFNLSSGEWKCKKNEQVINIVRPRQAIRIHAGKYEIKFGKRNCTIG